MHKVAQVDKSGYFLPRVHNENENCDEIEPIADLNEAGPSMPADDDCHNNDNVNDEVRFNKDLSTVVQKNIISFYCKTNTPISNALDISTMLTSVINFITMGVKSKVEECTTLEEVQKFVSNIELDDSDFKSAHMFKKSLTDKGVYFQPKKFVIMNRFVHNIEDLDDNTDMESYHGIIMPIKEQIVAFLQLPGMLSAVLRNQNKYTNASSELSIRHFCQGELWRNIIKNNIGKTIIPVMIYNDDFGIDDSRGPHAGDNAISAFYYHFPSLPSHLKSKLQYIFVAMITLAKHIKECSPDSALYMLFHVFKSLEDDGVDITDETGKSHKIHIILTNIQGDNLGIHLICGFTLSFNSNFYCRFCLTPKNICKCLCELGEVELRTVEG